MESQIIKEGPVLLIDLVGGAAGFLIALGWWKAAGRSIDRESVMFIAKIFAGITLLGMLMAFIF